MKNILLLVLICVCFVSCDGRKSESEALKTSIAEFNDKQSNYEIEAFYPKEYSEVITDTILSNKIKVHIKNYSLPNVGIFMSSSDDVVFTVHKLHRVFESDILVSTPEKDILSMHISADNFNTRYPDIFWTQATLQYVWVNQELSTAEEVKVDMSFINPKDNSYKLYRMSIDLNGNQEINLIEQQS